MAAGAVASRNMRIDFRVADRPRLAHCALQYIKIVYNNSSARGIRIYRTLSTVISVDCQIGFVGDSVELFICDCAHIQKVPCSRLRDP